MFVDTHVHLNRYARPTEVIAEARGAGVVCVAMTESPADFEAWAPYLVDRDVRLALGAHPLRAADLNEVDLARFADLLERVRYVGEVGLDGSREGRGTLPEQRRVFARVLELVRNDRHVLSVHSRGAEREVIVALAEAGATAVLHWYSGPLRDVDSALDAGLYFSINAAMVRSQNGAKLLRALPRDRVLTETDGPFVAVGGRRSRPSDIPALVTRLGQVWGADFGEAASQVWENMARLFAGAGEVNERVGERPARPGASRRVPGPQ